MLATIDGIFEARLTGETKGLSDFISDNATFRYAGENTMMDAFKTAGPVNLIDAVAGLNDLIALHRYDCVTALAEEGRMASLWNIEVSFPGREKFETQIFNLWTFDPDGKVSDLIEFLDTAKLASETSALA